MYTLSSNMLNGHTNKKCPRDNILRALAILCVIILWELQTVNKKKMFWSWQISLRKIFLEHLFIKEN